MNRWSHVSFAKGGLDVENGGLAVRVRMSWHGIPRERSARLHLDTGEVSLVPEGEYWCEEPTVVPPAASGVTPFLIEQIVFFDPPKMVRRAPGPMLESLRRWVIQERVLVLDQALPPAPERSRPRF